MSTSVDAESSVPLEPSTVDTTPPSPLEKPPTPLSKETDTRDYQKELDAALAQDKTYAEQYQGIVEQRHKLDAEYQEKGRPLLENVQKSMTQLDQTPNIPKDPTIQAEIQAYQQKEPQGLQNIFGMIMMGATLAFVAFGRHRGWGARAGILQGFGNAMTAYAQNKKDMAKEQLDNAHRIQELVRQENTQRHQQFLEIMQNRRLNLNEKKDLFNVTEKLYGADVNRVKQGADFIQQQVKMLHDQERTLRDMNKLQITTHNKLSTFMFDSTPGKKWRDEILIRTNGKIDPRRSEEELQQASALYPYDQFLADQATAGKIDPTTGKPYPPRTIESPEKKQAFEQSGKEFAKKFFGGQ
jgi:hypothetical protein